MSEKKQAAVFIGLAIPILLGVGTFLADMRMDVNAQKRDLVELRIKDYRQHRDLLREHVRYGKAQLTALKGAMTENPEALGKAGTYRVSSLEDSIDINTEILENYVEENKHFGKGE